MLGMNCSLSAAAVLALAICATAPASAEEQVQGEVALSDPGPCEFFVVSTPRGFSLLEWYGGLYIVVEGDHVTGPLHDTGVHVIDVLGEGAMKVRVREAALDLKTARAKFFRRCKIDQTEPAGEVSATRR